MKISTSLLLLFQILLFSHINAQGPLACYPTADPDEICLGGQSLLHANASGGSGNYTYEWTSTPLGFYSSLPSPVVMPVVTTIYTVTVNDGYNMVSGSVTVTVHPLPVPDAGPDLNIPFGTSTTLQGSAGGGSGSYNYHWEPANMLIDPNVAYPATVQLVFSTLFSLVVTDAVTGCLAAEPDAMIVTISGGPLSVSPVAIPQEIFQGETSQLFSYASGGSENYSFSWTSDPPGFSSDLPDPVVMPQSTQTYIVAVNDGYNEVQGYVIVTVNTGEIILNSVAQPENICQGGSSNLYANATGGTGNFMYYWTSNPVGFESVEANPAVIPSQNTLYIVEVFDGFNVASDSVWLYVYSVPFLYSLSIGGSICPGSNGVELFLSGSESNINYELFRNSYSTGMTVTGTGSPISFGFQNQEGDYWVIGSNIGCQIQMDNIASILYANFKDEICMINVDSLTGKNVLVWNKTQDDAIASYNIYRESTTGGNFNLIGTSDHDDPGIFTDNSSNPLQRSFSYGLTTIDTCSNESAISTIHTTMHLSINAGINSYNLIWTPYTGFAYQTYFIYRRQLPDGFQVIDSVPNSILSYSDLNPPGGLLDYVIEIRNNNGCDTQNDDYSYTSVFSNIVNTNVGINDPGFPSAEYLISPNPAKDALHITSLNYNTSSCELLFYDLPGRMIVKALFNAETTLNLQGVEAGIYLLIIRQDKRVESHKVVVY